MFSLQFYRITDGAASGISDVSVGGKDIVSIGRDGGMFSLQFLNVCVTQN